MNQPSCFGGTIEATDLPLRYALRASSKLCSTPPKAKLLTDSDRLYELIEAVKEFGAEDALEMLNVLIEAKRLKDISDLPMDLAI